MSTMRPLRVPLRWLILFTVLVPETATAAAALRLTFSPMQDPLSVAVALDGIDLQVVEFDRYRSIAQTFRRATISAQEANRYLGPLVERLVAEAAAYKPAEPPGEAQGDTYSLTLIVDGRERRAAGILQNAAPGLQRYAQELLHRARSLPAGRLSPAYGRATLVDPARRRALAADGQPFPAVGALGYAGPVLSRCVTAFGAFVPIDPSELTVLTVRPPGEWRYVLSGGSVFQIELLSAPHQSRPK